MGSVSIRKVVKRYGENTILRGIDLEIADGELVVLVGPSGCGKSTLLRSIAGLESIDAGTLLIGDRDVTNAPPRERDVAMVFQSYALYPHLSVKENLAFGLKLRKTDAATIAARSEEVAAMLGLSALLDRLPRQLSGGQRQRVAMGRAIVRRPELFLFDEPLSNLDAALRTEVRVEIRRLHHELAKTMVYVTHDQVEAMTLADRLVVLDAGVVQQVGPPMEVYDKPSNRFVAAFLGSPSMCFLRLEREGDLLRGPGVKLPAPSAIPAGAVDAGIRAQSVRVEKTVPAGEALPDDAPIAMRVEVVEILGPEAFVHGRVGEVAFVAQAPLEVARAARPGDHLILSVAPEAIHTFDPETGLAC